MTQEAGAVRRGRRSGGGAARRAERTATRSEFSRFITRNVPDFEILNTEALEIIEANAETVLQEVGVNFVDNPAALALWKDAGADIDGERVRIPRGWRASFAQRHPRPLRSMRATPNAMSRSAGATWFWHRSMARPSCVIRRAVAAMRQSRISAIS